MLLQFFHIEVAAVLYTPVGVMDESRQVVATDLFYGHAECPERKDCRQRFRQTPADDLLRVCIRDEVQVAASIVSPDVSGIAIPALSARNLTAS